MKHADELTLIAQVLVFKNKNAFGLLVQKYQSPVRRIFLHLTCGDRELSDDLAQDTFIKAYLNLSSFKKLSGFSTWLYRIAYNVFYDYIRNLKATTPLDVPGIDSTVCTEPNEIDKQVDIYRALNQLREEERICITLFYLEDISIEKIAYITKMPTGTIKSHLSRGKEKLATYLHQNGYDRKQRR